MTPSAPPRELFGNPPTVTDGANAGRLVATQLAGLDPAQAESSVESLARAGVLRLRQMGVDTEVVRSRPGCLVVRSSVRPPGDPAWACAVVAGWLEALPEVVFEAAGTVAESTCTGRGARTCIHTLMWRPPAARPPTREPAAAKLDPALLAVATPPPARTGAQNGAGHATANGSSAQNGAAAPVAPPHVAPVPTPAPVPTIVPPVPTPAPVQTIAPPVQTIAPPVQTIAPPVTVRTTESAPAPASAQPPHAPAPAPAPPARPDAEHRGAPPPMSAKPPSRWPWLRRRAWLLVVGLLAGSLGGYVARSHASASYSATAVVEITSASSTTAATNAEGAAELAVTYAALIPSDQSLLSRVGGELRMATGAVGRDLSVQTESGTALIELRFSDADATEALEGANDVARALGSSAVPGNAIAAGSVSVVSPARAAAPSGSLHKYGLPLGILLGLVVGAGAVLVAERADRRVDDLDGLAGLAGCAATRAPGGISYSEVARGLSRESDHVTVVPVRAEEAAAAAELAASLAAETASATGRPVRVLRRVDVAQPFAVSPQALAGGGKATVLVVARGERAAVVEEAANRLRLIGRDPALAVLVGPAPPVRDARAVDGGHGAPRQ